ncbi:pyruvate kinase [Corynebacterium doosanense]|uniref:pyruvate kinase n=1 Tax=Corynebacterium doosanense TaxID=1121358 RepID=UPI0026A20048
MTCVNEDGEGMDEQLHTMLGQLDAILTDLDAEAEAKAAVIERVHPRHREGAVNLIHYSLLRDHDVRELQAGLSAIGATRLTTTEPAVKARVQAARNVVGAYLGLPVKFGGDEVRDAFHEADDILDRNSDELLGPNAEGTHSRIMVTLPSEAADDADLVLSFAEAGMEVARINCAHDGPDAWGRMIEHVHRAEESVGRRIRVAMDLAGPKLRTGAIAPGPAVERARVTRTEVGETITPAKIWLVPAESGGPREAAPEPPAGPGRPTVTVLVDDRWLDRVAEGDVLSLVDTRNAKREFTAAEVVDVDGVRCVLATGDQNAYLSNSTLIQHDFERTRISGIRDLEQHLLVSAGDTLTLTTDPTPVDPSAGDMVIGCTLPEAVRAIEPGQPVLFDDGTIEAVAGESSVDDAGNTRVVLNVVRAKPGGTKLRAYKGINLPQTVLPLPSLTDEDIVAFEFVARHGDIANVSFIRNAADVAFVLSTLAELADTIEKESGPEAGERARNLGVVLKIETIPAYESLASVLLEGMRHENLGVMIARGDLAVEFGFERLAEVPRLIMNMSEAAHVPTIMATQVLESLAKSGLPSRAEITDAAYALRAEAVMLNKGPHITDAIRILNTISAKLGSSQRKNRIQLRRIKSWHNAL